MRKPFLFLSPIYALYIFECKQGQQIHLLLFLTSCIVSNICVVSQRAYSALHVKNSGSTWKYNNKGAAEVDAWCTFRSHISLYSHRRSPPPPLPIRLLFFSTPLLHSFHTHVCVCTMCPRGTINNAAHVVWKDKDEVAQGSKEAMSLHSPSPLTPTREKREKKGEKKWVKTEVKKKYNTKKRK